MAHSSPLKRAVRELEGQGVLTWLFCGFVLVVASGY